MNEETIRKLMYKTLREEPVGHFSQLLDRIRMTALSEGVKLHENELSVQAEQYICEVFLALIQQDAINIEHHLQYCLTVKGMELLNKSRL